MNKDYKEKENTEVAQSEKERAPHSRRNAPEVPEMKLNNGVMMPQVGFGLFQLEDPEQCGRCVRDAIDAGYRLFDTAAAYHNEDVLGKACDEAISSGRVKREDLFLQTKVWLSDFDGNKTRASVERSMERLRTDYIDLVILHQPFGDWQNAWKSLEKMYSEGKIRAIGVSNFGEVKIKELLSFANVKPQIDQIEMHPFYSEQRLLEFLRSEGIQGQAWGPMCEGLRDIFHNDLLMKIGRTHDRSAAQVTLRWNVQRDAAVVLKSTVREHMAEDLDIFGFELSNDEMKKINSMDIGHSEIIDFTNPSTERLLMKFVV